VTLSVSFTPTDNTKYKPATASVTLSVAQATPTVTWATPAAMTAGDQLSDKQLNATASVPGQFTYDPAAGTAVNAGANNLSQPSRRPIPSTTQTSTRASRCRQPRRTQADRTHGSGFGDRYDGRAPAAIDAGDLLAVNIDGKPGIKVVNGRVRVSGKGLKPDSMVTIYAFSSPQLLGSAQADRNGLVMPRSPCPQGSSPAGTALRFAESPHPARRS